MLCLLVIVEWPCVIGVLWDQSEFLKVSSSFLGSATMGDSISQESTGLIVWDRLEACLFIAVT